MDLSLGLEGTHVLITGAAGHIGKVVVKAFVGTGALVTAVDIDLKGLEKLQADFGARTQIIQADVSSESSLESAFNTAREKNGIIQCVIALAGLDLSVLSRISVADKSFEDWQRVMKVNVDGTFLTAKMWLRGIRSQVEENKQRNKIPGHKLRNSALVMVGSESGHWGENGCAEYSTSKSAITGGLLQSLKAESPRIYAAARVNAVAPGPVDTERFRQECKDDPNQLYVDSQATTALGQPVPPEVVAKTIVFLASESWSSHIHGQTINVDSGKLGKLMWSSTELKSS